jgi:hypothetical protein
MIEKSKPATVYPYTYPDPYNLKVTDIEGTQIGSKNRINKFIGNNYNLAITDIHGTRAGSKKKGIVTHRQTNPLDPSYILPGQVELGKNNNPYGHTLHATKTPPMEVIKEEVMPRLDSSKKSVQSNKENYDQVLGFNNKIYYEEKY